MLLFIIYAVSLTSPEVSYCTKPASMDVAIAQLSILNDWTKYHRCYTLPAIISATDPTAVKSIAGYTIPANGAHPAIAAPPCRLFGSD